MRAAKMGVGFPRPAAASSSILLMLGGVALWVGALPGVELRRMTDLGLVSVLPPPAYLGLAILAASFCLAVRRRETPEPVLLAHVAALVLLIHATPPLVYGTLRYSWAWKHVGIVDYIQRHGSVDPGIAYLNAYHNWPGFFALSALALGAAGVPSAVGVATWAPPAFNLLFGGGVLLVVRALTTDRRLVWLSVWLFVATNWVGQDYFSPQAFAYFLHLLIIGACLRWFGQPDAPGPTVPAWWPRPRWLAALWRRFAPAPARDSRPARPCQPGERTVVMAVVIALFTVVVPSHQLTPVMTTLAVAVLVLFRCCRARYLPLLMGVLTTIWAVYVATTFVQGNLYWIIQSIARPFDNLDSNFIDLSRASAGQRFIAMVDRVLTGSVGLLAALGFARRLRRGYRDLPALLLLLAPFPMLVANSYSGEMVFRIYLFMLPFAAFFAAALVFPSPEAGASPGAPALALLVSAGLLAGLCVAYYGKDRMYHFTENEVAAAEYLNATAGAGSLWIDGTWNWPVNYRGYELHDYRSLVSLPKPAQEALAERPVDVVEQLGGRSTEAYLIITRSQKADVDMTGVLPAGTLDRVEQAMLQARVPVVFANQDATIFALRSPSQPAGR